MPPMNTYTIHLADGNTDTAHGYTEIGAMREWMEKHPDADAPMTATILHAYGTDALMINLLSAISQNR